MSWRWIVLLPVVMLACGGDDGGADTTAAVAPSPPAVPTTAGPDPGTRSSLTTTATTAATSTSTTPPTGTAAPSGIVPEGFAAAGATITAADGTVCEVCLWMAVTAADRSRGLMGVTDLGAADGMVFVWETPTQSQFWMRDTPSPLSIAFFAADGSFVSSADMAPCTTGPAESCPRYAAAGPYTSAIEVFPGGLDAIGIGAGSRLELLDTPCDPAADNGT